MCCLRLSNRDKNTKTTPTTMPNLIIRNLTVTPLELRRIERFDADAVGSNGFAKVTSRIVGIFNSTENYGVVPKSGDPASIDDCGTTLIGGFESRETEFRAAEPQREVLRIHFQQPNTGNCWSVDAPGPSHRTLVMRRTAGSEDSPAEFSVVYHVVQGHLAIFSSGGLANWMAQMRDECPLSMLSIPGTHNSPTCYKALPSVRCQAVGVREQLDNGVRFLDVRVSVQPDSDELILVHAAFPVSLTGNKYLHDLLKECYDFLEANPKEALIMSLKREGTGKGSDADLSKHLINRYCTGQFASRWYTDTKVPHLGSARGRILLVRRYHDDEAAQKRHNGRGFGIDGSHWPDNCEDGTVGSGLIRVQDFYEIDQSTNIERKIQYARAQLERAAEKRADPRGEANPLFVNFLTASNFFNANCWPENIAAEVNPSIIEYLCMMHGADGKGPNGLSVGDSSTGVVVTDWVGKDGDWDLIRCIVGWNARLQLR